MGDEPGFGSNFNPVYTNAKLLPVDDVKISGSLVRLRTPNPAVFRIQETIDE
jgi:hypothetical protein